MVALQWGNPVSAITLIEETTRAQPGNPAFPADLAQAHLALQRVADARAAKPDPRDPQAGEIESLSLRVRPWPAHDLTALNEVLEALHALPVLVDNYVGVSNPNMHLRAGRERRRGCSSPGLRNGVG